jgi:chemotaxis protein CheX
MNVEYINPFIEASQSVLRQIAGINAKLGKVYLKTQPHKGDNVMVIVGLTGEIRGQAVFAMSKEISMHIASCMMGGMPVNELDEISKSAVSELTNMILGNTSTILYNKGIKLDITPPTFLMGENMEVYSDKMQTICVPLNIGEGKVLEIDISVEKG